MRRIQSLGLAVLALVACREHVVTGIKEHEGPPNPQSVSVLTQHNDNTRAGWNDRETALTTDNVNPQQFGKRFVLSVDDQVYAQPLVVGGLSIAGHTRNVVYVATVNNSVYAFDGDDGTLYWNANFTVGGMRPPKNTDMTGACGGHYSDFSGNIGIVGTPVIDPATGTMYFVARSTNGSAFAQQLHAVDIVTGSERAGSPVDISATIAGSGAGSFGGFIPFDLQRQNQRQALTLVNGVVYVTFSSHCDWGPYHGWILGYDASTLAQRTVYNNTPDGYAGGIWQSGGGMAADEEGNLYVVSGNGTVGAGADPSDARNRAESATKLVPSGSTLSVATFFTPRDYEFLNQYDFDYGVLGSLLIPGTSGFLTGTKGGKIILLDRDDMGGYSAEGDQAHQVVQLSTSAMLHGQPAFYGGDQAFVYVWSENDALRAFPYDRATNRLDEANQVVVGGGPTGGSGAVLSVSSNGTLAGTGILWASYAFSGDAGHEVTPGILRAFDAADVTKELWNNRQNPDDIAGAFAKFSAPTVANGHVYLPTFSNQVVVYGLRPEP